jgi:hypothetical protein
LGTGYPEGVAGTRDEKRRGPTAKTGPSKGAPCYDRGNDQVPVEDMLRTRRWFRSYDDDLYDPSLWCLPHAVFRLWYNLQCLANQYGGLPLSERLICDRLGIRPARGRARLAKLHELGLVRRDDSGRLRVVDWHNRLKYVPSDHAAERTARWRKRARTGGIRGQTASLKGNRDSTASAHLLYQDDL